MRKCKWNGLLLLALLSAGLLAVSCNDNSCPDGMHEQKLQDGSTICVPDDN